MSSCHFCNSTENLEEHHLLPVRKVANSSSLHLIQEAESQRNKVKVCHTCHQKLEDLYDEHFWKLAEQLIKNHRTPSPSELAEKTSEIDKELNL